MKAINQTGDFSLSITRSETKLRLLSTVHQNHTSSTKQFYNVGLLLWPCNAQIPSKTQCLSLSSSKLPPVDHQFSQVNSCCPFLFFLFLFFYNKSNVAVKPGIVTRAATNDNGHYLLIFLFCARKIKTPSQHLRAKNVVFVCLTKNMNTIQTWDEYIM